MAITALLDTNICIYIARDRPAGLAARFAATPTDTLAISLITWGELCFGAMKSQQSALAMNLLERFASRVPVLALDQDVGVHYGEIRAQLERAGTPIGNNDLWIAAHARALGMRLITNNAREFERVPGLVVERWV